MTYGLDRAYIRKYFPLSHEIYESLRTHTELKAEDVGGDRHRIVRLMLDNGMKALQKDDIRRRLGVTIEARSHRRFWIRIAALTRRTKSGAPTSSSSEPPQAGRILPSWSNGIPAGPSIGARATE